MTQQPKPSPERLSTLVLCILVLPLSASLVGCSSKPSLELSADPPAEVPSPTDPPADPPEGELVTYPEFDVFDFAPKMTSDCWSYNFSDGTHWEMGFGGTVNPCQTVNRNIRPVIGKPLHYFMGATMEDSRFNPRGSLEVHGGMNAFYAYEATPPLADPDAVFQSIHNGPSFRPLSSHPKGLWKFGFHKRADQTFAFRTELNTLALPRTLRSYSDIIGSYIAAGIQNNLSAVAKVTQSSPYGRGPFPMPGLEIIRGNGLHVIGELKILRAEVQEAPAGMTTSTCIGWDSVGDRCNQWRNDTPIGMGRARFSLGLVLEPKNPNDPLGTRIIEFVFYRTSNTWDQITTDTVGPRLGSSDVNLDVLDKWGNRAGTDPHIYFYVPAMREQTTGIRPGTLCPGIPLVGGTLVNNDIGISTDDSPDHGFTTFDIDVSRIVQCTVFPKGDLMRDPESLHLTGVYFLPETWGLAHTDAMLTNLSVYRRRR